MNEHTRAAPGQELSRTAFKRLADCSTLNEAFQTKEFMDRMSQGLPRHLNPNAMLRTFVQAVSKQPLILKCDYRQSVGAFLTLGELGLMPNNGLGHAFLIPFARKRWNPSTRSRELDGYDLQVIIGYKGYAELAYRSPQIASITADVVRQGDDWLYEQGLVPQLKHIPRGQSPENADLICAYSIAYLRDAVGATPPFKVVPYGEIIKTRNGSQGFRTAKAALENALKAGRSPPGTWLDAPWVKHFDAMAMKTAWLRLANWVPKSLEMQGATVIDEAGERGARIDFTSVFDGVASAVDGSISIQEQEPEPDTVFGARAREEDPAPGQQQKPAAPAAAFAAAVITADGELAAECDDPVTYARKLLQVWNAASVVEREAIAEFNADGIESAQENAEAAALLRELDEEPVPQQRQPAAPAAAVEVVRPRPGRGGKPAYTEWTANMRTALEQRTIVDLAAWLDAHRELIAAAPFATRISVLNAAHKRAVKVGIEIPEWFGDLTKPDAPAAPRPAEQRETQPQQQPSPQQEEPPLPTEDPGESDQPEPAPEAGPAPEPQPPAANRRDNAWADDLVTRVGAVKDRNEIMALARDTIVQTIMRRLKEERPDLWTDVNDAFAGAMTKFPKTTGEGA